jgi:hypothetical protein
MRFRQPAILHGLPRDLTAWAPGSTQNSAHLSFELLHSMSQSGSSLNQVHIRHLKECRDCRDLVAEFCPGELKESLKTTACGSTKC